MTKPQKSAQRRARASPRSGSRTAAPRSGRPPGQTSEQTRQRILLAARECFAQLGFERATNRDIAAACGLTAAAVYRHFDSKPDLYAAVMRDASAELVVLIRAAIASQPSARAALQAIIVNFTSAEAHKAAGLRFLSGVPTEMQRHPEVAQRVLAEPGEVFTIMNEIVDAGVRAGEIPRAKSESLVSMLIAMMMGLSAYANALGFAQGELAVAGFVDLFSGKLWKPAAK
jgi:AcrR family transcriptional regulator